MVERVLSLLGPLAYPECRRVARRASLIWLRLAPTVLAALCLIGVLTVGRLWAALDPSHHLDDDIRAALVAIVDGVVGLVLILTPALLAGSIAGEKERGSIALLLTTEATPRDIVLARWAARLAELALVAGPILPFLVGLLALASVPPSACLALGALAFALSLGGGGLALAVSALARRGRDALFLVYLLEIVALIASLFLARPGAFGGLALALNPFLAVGPLIDEGEVAPSLGVAAGWAGLGLLGFGVASWRLRASGLGEATGRPGRPRRGAWRRVPPVGDRPMLWKELYIDRAGSLGRVGRWVGGLVAAWLGLGSIALALLAARDGSAGGVDSGRAIELLGSWYGRTAVAIGLLIQWGIGLRSAAMVASERERGTWDGLLTSPLTPAEIVAGKLGGSWYALRWLAGSALVAWTLTALHGGMTPYRYALTLAETLIWGTLMAAFGLAVSLRMGSATRAMAATMLGWCVLFGLAKLVALLVTSFVVLGFLYLSEAMPPAQVRSWFAIGQDWGSLALAALIAAQLLIDSLARFDRLAGRATGGGLAMAVDRLVHGRPMAPVRLDPARPDAGRG